MLVLNRTYVGLSLPDPLAAAIMESVLPIKRRTSSDPIHWLDRSELILDVVALGELREEQIVETAHKAAAICAAHSPFVLELDRFEGRPTDIIPRAIGVGFYDRAALTALQEDLRSQLATARGPIESAAPPWIAIGRLTAQERPASRTNLGIATRRAELPLGLTLPVGALEILIAVAGDQGPSYQPLYRLPLSQV